MDCIIDSKPGKYSSDCNFFNANKHAFLSALPALILLTYINKQVNVMQGKEKPQVFIINKGSNLIISVQFAFNGQKG